MGVIYAKLSIELLVAEYGDLAQSEILEINQRSYRAVPIHVQNGCEDIRKGRYSLFDFVQFKDGKYVLTDDARVIREKLQNNSLVENVIKIAFFNWNYKPSFWQKEIE